jgi:hypothetical protein
MSTPRCRLVPFADVFQLMAVADAAVCMGGYNTLCEGLMTACPMVIVPRATHKVEQLIRPSCWPPTTSPAASTRARPARRASPTRSSGRWPATGGPRPSTCARRCRRSTAPRQLTGYLSPWLNGE